MAKYVNTVPQGRAGTGNAVIYGDNPVASQYANQLSSLRERERQQALLQQREAERLAKSFRDNQLAASEGRLWADQVGKIEQDHIQKGIELKQRGIDPYGSSKDALDYQRERRQVQSQQGYRKAQEAQYNALIKGIQAKGVENFEPEDIAQLNKFVSEGKLSDAYSGNLQLPTVRERFSPNTLLKDVKAITQNDVDVNGNIKSDKKFIDTKATQEAIIGRLNSDPRGQQFLNKITGGIPVQQVMSIPKTLEANRNDIIKEYQGNPQLRQKLATDAGIIGEGAEFDKWVNEMAKVRSNARNSFDNQMENFVANASQGVQLWDKETPDYGAQNQAIKLANLDLSQRRENRLASEASGSGSGSIEAPMDVPLYYGKGGKSVTTGKGVVKIPMANKNFVGAKAINLKDGRPSTLTKSSNNYEVVSVGNYPVLSKDITIKRSDGTSETLKKGSLVQEDYATKFPQNIVEKPFIHVQDKDAEVDRLVDYSYMPKGLTKAQKEALGSFRPAQPTQSTPAPKKSATEEVKETVTVKETVKPVASSDDKKIGMAQPLKTKTSIMKGDISAKARAAGYTVPEYMELLKKRGVKILD
jgi:hypothetical protein